MWYVSVKWCDIRQLLRWHSQVNVVGIQGALESVCCPGCMRAVSPQEVVWSGWQSLKVDCWGYDMQILLLVEVIYWAFWGGHRRVEWVLALMGLNDVWFHHLFNECCEDNQGWKGHHFWWLKLGWNWVPWMWRGQLGVPQFSSDVKGGVHEAYSTSFVKCFDD